MLTTLEERVGLSHTALLVVDLQNDFVHDDGAFAKMGINVSMFQQIIPRVNALIDAARGLQVPVIYVQMIHSQWTNSDVWVQRVRVSKAGWAEDKPKLAYCVPGTWGSQWYEALRGPADNDHVVTKHRYSAFVNTDLDLVLRSTKRKSVVVTGGETNLCLGTTAMSALQYDYYVVLPSDCIAGINKDSHRHGLQLLDGYFGIVTTSKEVVEIWKAQNEKRSNLKSEQ